MFLVDQLMLHAGWSQDGSVTASIREDALGNASLEIGLVEVD